MRFLFDECLCHGLIDTAVDGGHEAHNVVRRGWQGESDRALMPRIIAGDFTFVTNNAVDFRRLFATEELHEGLVILLPSVPSDLQVELFAAVLADLAVDDKVVNMAIEADFAPEGETGIRVNRYDLSLN